MGVLDLLKVPINHRILDDSGRTTTSSSGGEEDHRAYGIFSDPDPFRSSEEVSIIVKSSAPRRREFQKHRRAASDTAALRSYNAPLYDIKEGSECWRYAKYSTPDFWNPPQEEVPPPVPPKDPRYQVALKRSGSAPTVNRHRSSNTRPLRSNSLDIVKTELGNHLGWDRYPNLKSLDLTNRSGNTNHAKPPLFVNEGNDWLVIDSKGLQDDEIHT